MKYAIFIFFTLFISVSTLMLPYKVAACETYEQPCGGDEDRTKGDDDGRRYDDIDGTDDRDTRRDNEDNEPAF